MHKMKNKIDIHKYLNLAHTLAPPRTNREFHGMPYASKHDNVDKKLHDHLYPS